MFAALLVWLAPALLTPLVAGIDVALFRRLEILLAAELSTLESAEAAEDSVEDASVEAALETEDAPDTVGERGVLARGRRGRRKRVTHC